MKPHLVQIINFLKSFILVKLSSHMAENQECRWYDKICLRKILNQNFLLHFSRKTVVVKEGIREKFQFLLVMVGFCFFLVFGYLR